MADTTNSQPWYMNPALWSFAGNALQGYSNSQDQQANRQMSQGQFAANQAQRAHEFEQTQHLQQAQAAKASAPLGQDQQYAQRMALANAILPGLRNASLTPGDPMVRGAMPQSQGGLRLPEWGLPQSVLSLYGPEATLASLKQNTANLQNIDPRYQGMDWGTLYGGAGASASQAVGQRGQQLQEEQALEKAKTAALVQAAIDKDAGGGSGGKTAAALGLGGAAAAALLGGGNGAEGNLSKIIDYFKNRNKPKGPDDMSQPGTVPGTSMADILGNPFSFEDQSGWPTGLGENPWTNPNQDLSGYDSMPGGDWWDTPPPPQETVTVNGPGDFSYLTPEEWLYYFGAPGGTN